MIVPNLPATKITPYELTIDKYRGGTNTLINETSLSQIFAKVSTDLWQVQDGIWKTRPGLSWYGEEISGETSIKNATVYKKDNTDGTYTLQIIAIGGTGKVYKSEDNALTWTEVTGATFTGTAKPFFLQINNRLYISDGSSDLAYYDGTSLHTYTAIDNPSSAMTGALTSLTTGSYNNYYRYVAVNSVGFTAVSLSVNKTTNKHRDTWSGTDKITLTIPAVTGATGYQIFWGEIDGNEYFVGETTTTTWEDTGGGTFPQNPYLDTPDDNTTGAPKFQSMEVSGNRIWGTKIKDTRYRVYASGTGTNLGNFSPFYDGVYIDLEKGGPNEAQSVVHYRTGKGDPIVTVFCSDFTGNGSTFQIELTTLSVGDVTFVVPVAYKIVGATGADSPHFVCKVNDDIFAGNKKRVFSLRNKQQMFNILSTDDLITPNRPSYESLNHDNFDKYTMFYKAPRVYMSMTRSHSSTENDVTAIFDVERNNWNWAWSVGFRQFFEYKETDEAGGQIRLLGVTNSNKLTLIDENTLGDYGTGFYQEYLSPLFPVSQDVTDIAKIREVIFELGSLRGKAYVEVIGIRKGKGRESLASDSVEEISSSSGIGADLFSDFLFSGTNSSTSVTIQSTRKKTVKVGKKVYYIQFRVYTQSQPTQFELLKIQAKGFLMKSRPDSTWNN